MIPGLGPGYSFLCCNYVANCLVYLYCIHCIMIMAGVGQLLDRDTALLFFGANLEENLECPSQTAMAQRWLNDQSSFLKCRALGASCFVLFRNCTFSYNNI